MSEQKAGRELDALIAEKVMDATYNGFYVTVKDEFPIYKFRDDDSRILPPYSTDIADAWAVVEKVNAAFFNDVDLCLRLVHRYKWRARWGGDMRSPIYEADAETAPLAICLAALKAMGAE